MKSKCDQCDYLEEIEHLKEVANPYRLHYGNLKTEIAREILDRLKTSLIKKGDVIDALWNTPNPTPSESLITVKHIDRVVVLPAADVVEVRHGEWVNKIGLYECSACGKTCPYDVQADVISYWECRYCPNCGAKMDGGK